MKTPDVTLRSRVVTDGVEATTSRGMGDDDWGKPQIGIASSWNETTPGHLSRGRLAKGSEEGSLRQFETRRGKEVRK